MGQVFVGKDSFYGESQLAPIICSMVCGRHWNFSSVPQRWKLDSVKCRIAIDQLYLFERLDRFTILRSSSEGPNIITAKTRMIDSRKKNQSRAWTAQANHLLSVIERTAQNDVGLLQRLTLG